MKEIINKLRKIGIKTTSERSQEVKVMVLILRGYHGTVLITPADESDADGALNSYHFPPQSVLSPVLRFTST